MAKEFISFLINYNYLKNNLNILHFMDFFLKYSKLINEVTQDVYRIRVLNFLTQIIKT